MSITSNKHLLLCIYMFIMNFWSLYIYYKTKLNAWYKDKIRKTNSFPGNLVISKATKNAYFRQDGWEQVLVSEEEKTHFLGTEFALEIVSHIIQLF